MKIDVPEGNGRVVAVGLSGGVDSSVSALLLKERGWQVVGVTMKLWRGQYKGGDNPGCFGAGEEKNIAIATELAQTLGIDYRVFDVSEEYDKRIVDYFRQTYLSGNTPNPCVRCNAVMKFGLLPDLAQRGGLHFEAFATGHYARIERVGERYAIARAVDLSKDQSYFLYRLSQKQLARHIFPLGSLTKQEVRDLARERGLLTAERRDSQDFYTGETDELIGAEPRAGEIVDTAGKCVGHHQGFWHYTIGQRKGLGIGGAGDPYYVVDVDAAHNRVIIGRLAEASRTEFTVEDVVEMGIQPGVHAFDCRVKVRSAGRLVPAHVEGERVTLSEPLMGIAPGQSAVFYDLNTEVILAGGIIARENQMKEA